MPSLHCSKAEAWGLLDEIKSYLLQTSHFPLLKNIIKGKVTPEKVVSLLKELSELEVLKPAYHENKDTEIVRMNDVGEGVRNHAKEILAEWEKL